MVFITKQLIDKGWSGDKKYCVPDEKEENAHRLTSDEQYFYGFEAGRILKNNTISFPHTKED